MLTPGIIHDQTDTITGAKERGNLRDSPPDLVSLEELEIPPDKADAQSAANRRMDLNRLFVILKTPP
jgi:hypothetical protein